MPNIFRESNYRREVDAGEKQEGPGTRIRRPPAPTGGASKDLVKGGPSSSFKDPAEEELKRRKEEQERIRREAIERERAKRK